MVTINIPETNIQTYKTDHNSVMFHWRKLFGVQFAECRLGGNMFTIVHRVTHASVVKLLNTMSTLFKKNIQINNIYCSKVWQHEYVLVAKKWKHERSIILQIFYKFHSSSYNNYENDVPIMLLWSLCVPTDMKY